MKHCDHCQLPILKSESVFRSGEFQFCCLGCKTIFLLFKQEGLEDYYHIKKELNENKWAPDYKNYEINKNWQYLDSLETQKDYLHINDDGELSMKFYISDIHCTACLWLMEKLPEICPDAKKVSVNYTQKVVVVTIRDNSKFSNVAQLLTQLGYLPNPVKSDEEVQELQNKENRKLLIKLSVAGACTGNIMLMAISLYSGAKGQIATVLSWSSFVLFLPIIFYSATPFYKKMFVDLKNKRFSIDIPIVIALILGLIISTYHLIIGNEHVYFDSLSSLIFLLLGSRYLLARVTNQSSVIQGLSDFFHEDQIQKTTVNGDDLEKAHVKSLKVGDLIKVYPQQIFPCDGQIISGESYADFMLLNGESHPQKISSGEKILSGVKNLNQVVIFKINKSHNESKLMTMINEVQDNWLKNNHIIGISEKIAAMLLSLTFIIGTAVLVVSYMNNNFYNGIERFLAILIIACPCALGLGSPLVLALSMKRALKKAIVIKNANTISKLSQIETIIFDKTGTLTNGKFGVEFWNGDTSHSVKQAVYSIESHSSHPLAISICEYLHEYENAVVNVSDFQNVPGKGVSGIIENDHWEIISSHNNHEITAIDVIKNSHIVATIGLADTIRNNAHWCVQKLQKYYHIKMLTGDNFQVAQRVAKTLGISDFSSDMSPDDKRDILSKIPNSLMIGDGLNDLLAMSKADVGVAIRGALSINLKTADVFIQQGHLTGLIELFEISKHTMKTLRQNISLSLIYNLGGIGLAAFGYIHPLAAAVLMPLSSLTVLTNTIYSHHKNQNEKEQKDMLWNTISSTS